MTQKIIHLYEQESDAKQNQNSYEKVNSLKYDRLVY